MNIKENINVSAKTISILVTVTLVATIIYEFGFLFAVGLSFSQIPISTGDELNTALVWLPITVLAIFVAVAVEWITRYLEHGLTEEEIIEQSPDPERTRKKRRRPFVFFAFACVLVILVFILFGSTNRWGLVVAVPITWWLLSTRITETPLIRRRSNSLTIRLFQLLPAASFFVFFIGYNHAQDIAGQNVPHAQLVFLAMPRTVVDVNVLQYLGRGALVVNPKTKTISFYKWSQIARIEKIGAYKPFSGLLRGWRIDSTHTKKTK